MQVKGSYAALRQSATARSTEVAMSTRKAMDHGRRAMESMVPRKQIEHARLSLPHRSATDERCSYLGW